MTEGLEFKSQKKQEFLLFHIVSVAPPIFHYKEFQGGPYACMVECLINSAQEHLYLFYTIFNIY
jgi:hypothetical protein